MTTKDKFCLELPVSVINRALELFGKGSESSVKSAVAALISVENRMAGNDFLKDGTSITYFARALAEFISQSGPWSESGEMAGQTEYRIIEISPPPFYDRRWDTTNA